MSLPDKAPLRKPPLRLGRIGLYAPFALLLVLVVAWSLLWGWMRGEVFSRMDLAAQALDEAGYRVDWSDRDVSGYPFRLDLEVERPSLAEPSGWGLAAPRLKAEAFVFAPETWVIVAPEGATLTRPRAGPVMIAAKALRASVSEPGATPPRISVEGLGLTFTTPASAKPLSFTAADELHLHAKAGPLDQGGLYIELDKARPRPGGWLADLGGGAPATFIVDGIFSHAASLMRSQAPGDGWAGALRAWSNVGGGVEIRRASLAAGPASARAESGALGLNSDGRLTGQLPLALTGSERWIRLLSPKNSHRPGALTARSLALAAGGATTSQTLSFEEGQTLLGPVAIGKAPRVIAALPPGPVVIDGQGGVAPAPAKAPTQAPAKPSPTVH